MKRFSPRAFVFGTFIHVAGTALLVWLSFRLFPLYFFDSGPVWLDVLCWIWAPVPMLLARSHVPGYAAYEVQTMLLWSLCVGATTGLTWNRAAARRLAG